MNAADTARQMIRNGLHSITTTLLDGVHGGQTGVSVLRDGRMLGGGSILYHVGAYQCFDSNKWKGEVTSQEHNPTGEITLSLDTLQAWDLRERIPARAEFEATALVTSGAFD